MVASERTTARCYGLRSQVLVASAPDLDIAELRRKRRETRQRLIRRRRLTALAVLAALLAAAIFGLTRLFAGSDAGAAIELTPVGRALPASMFHTQLPEEIRGVHITGPLMSIPGKFSQYLALRKQGLNTVEIDLKDESGNVSFTQGAPALATEIGATRSYFDARAVARRAHAAGVYLIGRIVTFQDPIAAVAR